MTNISSDEALNKLLEGNQRFIDFNPVHPNQTKECCEGLISAQSPFAIIVSCSDSRIPPEIIFDQGLGDLFIVRVAGNIANDPAVLGSIEYAAEHLGVKLLMVLGHQSCGAVKATLDGGVPEGHIKNLVEIIKPAVDKAKLEQGDAIQNAVKANIRISVENLKTNEPILNKLVVEGKLSVVGAYYSLQTRKVEVI